MVQHKHFNELLKVARAELNNAKRREMYREKQHGVHPRMNSSCRAG